MEAIRKVTVENHNVRQYRAELETYREQIMAIVAT